VKQGGMKLVEYDQQGTASADLDLPVADAIELCA